MGLSCDAGGAAQESQGTILMTKRKTPELRIMTQLFSCIFNFVSKGSTSGSGMGSLPFRLICASKLVLGMTVSVYVY